MLRREADRGRPEWPDGGHRHTGSDVGQTVGIRSGIDGPGYGTSKCDHDAFGHDDGPGYGTSKRDHDAFGHDDGPGYGTSKRDHDAFGHDDGPGYGTSKRDHDGGRSGHGRHIV